MKYRLNISISVAEKLTDDFDEEVFVFSELINKEWQKTVLSGFLQLFRYLEKIGRLA